MHLLLVYMLAAALDWLSLFIHKNFRKRTKSFFSFRYVGEASGTIFIDISSIFFLVVEIFLLLVFYCNFSLKLLIFSWINCTWRQKLFLVPQQCHNWNFYFPMRIKELNWHPEAIVKLTSHFLLTLIFFPIHFPPLCLYNQHNNHHLSSYTCAYSSAIENFIIIECKKFF